MLLTGDMINADEAKEFHSSMTLFQRELTKSVMDLAEKFQKISWCFNWKGSIL